VHEMAIVQDVVKVVVKYAEDNEARQVVTVKLRVGEMRDVVDEWMQRFFDLLSRGTVAEGAKLEIERTPIVFRCECGRFFATSLAAIVSDPRVPCPSCSSENTCLYSGREFQIVSIGVV
jgi:hydrogenase nickel incorporation protein HypA/HybF